MTSDITEIKMNNEALDFVKNELSKGKSLSQFFMKIMLNKKVEIYALVPQNIDKQKLYNFDAGGLGNTNIDEYLLLIFKKFIQKITNNILIFEDSLAKRDAPFFLDNEIENIITYKDEVYYHVNDISASDTIISNILGLTPGYPSIIYLISLAENHFKQIIDNTLSESDLKYLSENVQEIIVGAYDEESYLRVKIL